VTLQSRPPTTADDTKEQVISPDRPGPPGGSLVPRSSPPWSAVLALAALSLIWGYNWVVMKIGLRSAEPFTFAALRTFLGAVTLFALLPAFGRPLRPTAPVLTLFIGLFQTTGFVGLIMWALVSGGAAKTSVLTYTMPFWLLLLAWAVLGERSRGYQWLAVGLALAGFFLILSPWRLHGVLSTLLAVAGGFCWAVSAVLVKVLQRRQYVDALSLTAWQMLLGSLPLIVIAVLTATRAPVWSTSFILALAYNVLPANALGWLLWLHILRSLSAGTAGIGSLAIPVIGVIAAWLQLGERPGPSEAAGIVLILAALALLTLIQALRQRRPAETPDALSPPFD
jgi:drug/metabolite transporter (DMT)-like permease